MKMENTLSAALIVSTTWDTESHSSKLQTSSTLVKNFRENILKPGTVSELYCTILDVEVCEDHLKDAERVGVTLIPAIRSEWSDPLEDPPVLNWLINHDKYYPQLKELKHIKHVVSFSLNRNRAAAAIHDTLFPQAVLHVPDPPPSVLILLKTWDTDPKSMAALETRIMIRDFCKKQLKTDEVTEVYCTVFDIEITKDQRKGAANFGVNLISAERSEWLKADEDPPGKRWLIHHDKYFPRLGDLQNVKHVVSFAPETKDAASVIHLSLFPQAELHQLLPLEPSAVLFAFYSWNEDGCGLSGFHRALIQDFCTRKVKSEEVIKVYSTVLDLKLTETQIRDAKKCNVTLIKARQKEWLSKKMLCPEEEWLLNHESHFPDLQKLQNVKYVVGYAPKTGEAAADIQKKLFPDAKLVLINHVCPENNCLMMKDEFSDLQDIMLKMASQADLLFSVGPKVYEYFQRLYKGMIDGIKLSDIPHRELLPKPRKLYLEYTPQVEPDINARSIITYGQLDTTEALQRCDLIADSVRAAANSLKDFGNRVPEWEIQGVSKHTFGVMKDKLASCLLALKPTEQYTAGSLLTSLQQSDLCLPPSCYTDYSFEGLEAMEAGLPTTLQDDSHIAELIIKHFAGHKHYLVVRKQTETLTKKIHENLQNRTVAFGNAKQLQEELRNSKVVAERLAEFASLFRDTGDATLTQQSIEKVENEMKGDRKQKDIVQQKISTSMQPGIFINEDSPTTASTAVQPAIPVAKGAMTTVTTPSQPGESVSKDTDTIQTSITQPETLVTGGTGTAKNTDLLPGTCWMSAAAAMGTVVSVSESKRTTETTPYLPWLPVRGDMETSKDMEKKSETYTEKMEQLEKGSKKRKLSNHGKIGEVESEQFQKKEKSTNETGRISRYKPPSSPGVVAVRKCVACSNDFMVHVGLNDEHYQHRRRSLEKHEQSKRVCELTEKWNNCKEALRENAERVTASEEKQRNVNDICKNYLGQVAVKGTQTESLGISLHLPTLYNLYRLENTCLSGTFPDSFEPLLITDNMREEATKVGLQVKLNATYDQAKFDELKSFFIKQHGGGLEPVKVFHETIVGEAKEIFSDIEYIDCKSHTMVTGEVANTTQSEQGQLLKDKTPEIDNQREIIENQLKEALEEKAALEARCKELIEAQEKSKRDLVKLQVDLAVKRKSFPSEREEKKWVIERQDKLEEEERPTFGETESQAPTKTSRALEREHGKNSEKEREYGGELEAVKAFHETIAGEAAEDILINIEDTDNKAHTMVTGEVAKTTQSEQGQIEGRHIECIVKTFGNAEDLFTLNNPCGLAISDNDLVMCDRDNHRVVVKKRASKQVSYLSFNSRFKLEFMPQDVVILSANNLLIITDRGNQQIVVSDCQCKLVRTFGHEQTNFEPFGIALMVPFVIVSDIAEHRIIKYTTEGEYTAEVGGYGKGYGQFNEPYSVAVNSVNQVIASDFHNHRVQVFNSELKFLYTVGTAESSLGPLRNPYGVDVDSDDNMYVCEFDKNRIVKFTKEGKPVCTLFESKIEYPMYIAISKGKVDQLRVFISQWQQDKIMCFQGFSNQ